MENTNDKLFSVIGIGSPLIDIIKTITNDEVVKLKLIEGKTLNADDSNISFIESFEANNASCSYLPSGSSLNTIKVVNVRLLN